MPEVVPRRGVARLESRLLLLLLLLLLHGCVWDKSARGNGMGWRYRRNYEFILVSHRKGGRLLWADDSLAVPNIVRHSPVLDRCHPNEKPVLMIADFLMWHTNPAHLILDPFMGAGSTAVACVQTGRRFIGIEIDPVHFQTACDRVDRELDQQKLPFTEEPQPIPASQREMFE